jgi:small subunit ribosomal protein S15
MALAAQDANQEMGLQYWLGRVLDLKNANSRGLLFENKKRILSAFSEPENPHDPGRPEVKGRPLSPPQNCDSILTCFHCCHVAALLTARIHRLWEYLQERKRDIHNRRRLLGIIRERAKILKYLRKTNRARYEAILPQLGLEKGAVEGELYLPREAFTKEELIGR